MKRIVIITILVFITSSLIYCNPTPNANKSTARIATWNLEWFGALGRTDDDIEEIAEIIRKLKIDVLSLQEITCECTLKDLADKLGYEYFISSQRVPQKLALLWNPARVDSVEFNNNAYDALYRVAHHGLGRESRQPIAFNIKIGQFDFVLVDVHLKSIPESDYSVEVRNVQYDAINSWLRSHLSDKNSERDVIIAGDFNSYNQGISSERFYTNGMMQFVTTDLKKNEYSNIWYDNEGNRNKSFIDHIAVSNELKRGEFKRVLPIRDLDVVYGSEYFENQISDHLPLVAEFSTSKDKD